MLSYPHNLCLLVLIAIAAIVLAIMGTIPWILAVLVVLVVKGIIIYGCSVLSSGFFMPVSCRGNTTEKKVALTFDDGPAGANTEAVLDILKEENIGAVFFCIGKNIAGREATVQRMHHEGHVVANHSFDHGAMFDLLGSTAMIDDLRLADAEVQRVTGKVPKLFRPPYGVINPALTKAIKTGGYQPLGWSIRSFDTTAGNADALTQRVIRNLHPGAVILLHDRCEVTASALRNIIQEIRRNGYTFERADRLLQLTPYA